MLRSLSRDRESLPFVCLSVSGRLRLRRSCSKGLSPDSSYRDGGMIHLSLRRHEAQARRDLCLSARLLCGPTQLDQLRDNDVTMVTLNFDDSVAYRTPGSTALLEFGGQGFDVRPRHRQTGNRRYSFACPPLDLPAHAYGRGFGGAGSALWAHTFTHRPATIGTKTPNSGRVNDSRAQASLGGFPKRDDCASRNHQPAADQDGHRRECSEGDKVNQLPDHK